MKMKIPVRRSCISLIVLSALVEAIRANENDNSTAEGRQGRVSGRIVKLYSGYKPDPVLCIEDGFKADPVQCSIFYRCVKSSSGKFTVFKFQCGPGTVYDPETEVCNHPSSTKRSECGGIKSHVEQDIEKENEIEQHELPSPISTVLPAYTSLANNNITYTTYKVPINSNLGSTGVFIPSTENGYINLLTTSSTLHLAETTPKEVQDFNHNKVIHPWTNDKNMTEQKYTLPTTIYPVLDKLQPCSTDGFMGDSENCKKFYRCVSNLRGGFIRYEFICSEPTIWDDHMQSCNHPWAVRSRRCGRGEINNENNMEDLHLSIISDVPPVHPGVNFGLRDPEAQEQDIDDVSKRKEHSTSYGDRLSNVNEYNNENNQISYGSYFSSAQPTMPNEDKNKGTEGTFYIDDVNNNYNFGQKTTVQDTYSTNKLSETNVPQSNGTERTFKCTHSGFVGDSNHCEKFYRCVENGQGSFTKYEFTCSQGTVWDKKLEACNYAWVVKECGGTSAVDSLITTGRINSMSTSSNALSENFDVGYTNQVNQEHELPTTIVSTSVSLISATAASNQIKTECTVTGFIGDKNDCKKFYRCVDNGRGTFTKYEYKCGDGTLWDQTVEACNHAWAVNSCNPDWSKTTIQTTSVTAAITPTTALLIQSTTPGKLQENNNYNEATGPQQEATLSDHDSGYGNQQSVSTKRPDIDSETITLKQNQSQTNSCQAPGFIGDVSNCTKFYRCVDNGNGGFIRHEFLCGDGTVWDSEIEACNHASAVQHCGNRIPSEENIIVTSSTTITSIVDLNNRNSTQKPIENMTPQITFETTSIINGNESSQCKANGFMGDTSDCKRFYRCVDSGNGKYVRYVFSCGEGTLWDPQINACNHAWAVKGCESSKEPTTNISMQPTSTTSNDKLTEDTGTPGHNNSNNYAQSTTSSSSTATMTTATNNNNECYSSGFMSDGNDCQKFYRCVDNGEGGFIKHEFVCGEGTVWDSKIEACNHKWAVQTCGDSSSPEFVETTSHSLTPTSSVIESEAISTLSTTTISTTPGNISPSYESRECSSEGFFANPNDCRKFYRCVNHGEVGYTKYDFSCAEGTAWDVKIQSCNYVNEVNSCQNSQNITEINPINDKQPTESETTKTTTSASMNTTDNPSNSEQSIESDTTKTTTSAYINTTDNTKPVGQNACKEEGFFGDTNNCKKFYRCVYDSEGKYTKYDFTCGDGTIWDQDVVACNHPYDVKNPSCTSEPESSSPVSTISTSPANSETSSSSTNIYMPVTTTSESVSNNNETNPNYSTSTTENPNSKNFTCSTAGFYSHPSNCKKFYRCVDWENNGKKFSIFHFECADGTIWDPALETCNHENSVYPPRNCNGTQQQNDNTTGTSLTTEETTTTTPATNQAASTTSSSEPTKTTMQSTTTTEYVSSQTTQSSTSKKPTTQPSTSKKPTSQPSTTKQPTTQLSTTEESTTQSTTTEQFTSQSSTTEQSTSQSLITEESTLQSSTTEESTTQSSTNGESTTQSLTTKQPSTQSPTTEESTTQSSSTKEPTTEESTTLQTTVGTSTTDEQSTQQTSSTTETVLEQTTKSSTFITTNKESSTVESSTTTTQMTTSATDQTSSTTDQYTTTVDSSSSSTTENSQESSTETSPNHDCPNTSDDQSLYVCPTSFKRHPKYCNLFYQCTEDNDSHELKIAVFNCPNNTVYDESKIKCVEEVKSSKKCNGQISQKHRVKRLGAAHNDPFIVSKESMACHNSGHFPFEKHMECSASLLKCELTNSGKLRGFVYRCPEDYVYWSISRRCEPIRKVRDCKRSSYPWKRRYDIPLERFNIAS